MTELNNEMTPIQNKFNHIQWMPIDIPKFPIVDFSLPMEADWYFWQITMLVDPRTSPYEVNRISDSVRERYPEFIEWLEYLPAKTLRTAKFNIQQTKVPVHIDFPQRAPEQLLLYETEIWNNNSQNDPCGFRVLLNGNRQKGLYFVDYEGNKIYANMPEDTDTYVLGSTNSYHGVEEDPNRTTMLFYLEIDPIRHQELLERSYKKYGEFAITTGRTSPNGQPETI